MSIYSLEPFNQCVDGQLLVARPGGSQDMNVGGIRKHAVGGGHPIVGRIRQHSERNVSQGLGLHNTSRMRLSSPALPFTRKDLCFEVSLPEEKDLIPKPVEFPANTIRNDAYNVFSDGLRKSVLAPGGGLFGETIKVPVPDEGGFIKKKKVVELTPEMVEQKESEFLEQRVEERKQELESIGELSSVGSLRELFEQDEKDELISIGESAFPPIRSVLQDTLQAIEIKEEEIGSPLSEEDVQALASVNVKQKVEEIKNLIPSFEIEGEEKVEKPIKKSGSRIKEALNDPPINIEGFLKAVKGEQKFSLEDAESNFTLKDINRIRQVSRLTATRSIKDFKNRMKQTLNIDLNDKDLSVLKETDAPDRVRAVIALAAMKNAELRSQFPPLKKSTKSEKSPGGVKLRKKPVAPNK